MSAISGIQGQRLEITVVQCCKLKNMEWLAKQDPYVLLEYASTKYRTRTHTDGGKNPTFNEKFMITLIEGLKEISFSVWNSNTFKSHDFIGSGRTLLNKVLCSGYDDMTIPLVTTSGKYAGEVKVIMNFQYARDAVRRNEARTLHLNNAGHSGTRLVPHPCMGQQPCAHRQQPECSCPYCCPPAAPFPYRYTPPPDPHGYQLPHGNYRPAVAPPGYPQEHSGFCSCGTHAGGWAYTDQ